MKELITGLPRGVQAGFAAANRRKKPENSIATRNNFAIFRAPFLPKTETVVLPSF
jgi:hypothetical protein